MRSIFEKVVLSTVPLVLLLGVVFVSHQFGARIEHTQVQSANVLASLAESEVTPAENLPPTEELPRMGSLTEGGLTREEEGDVGGDEVDTSGEGAVLSARDQMPQSVVSGERYLSVDERDELLTLHNAERAKVGVSPLRWSSYLAQSAEDWANALASRGCVLEHSGSEYGENIYYGRRYGSDLSPRTPAEVIRAFTDEKDEYSYSTNSCASGDICGHYTQIVWDGTTQVGCAKSLCLSDEREEVWVCHYDPPGNVEGLKPY